MLGLRFGERAIEAEYRRVYDAEVRPGILLGGLAAVVLLAASAFVDAVVVTDDLALALAVRAVAVGLVAAATWTTFRGRWVDVQGQMVVVVLVIVSWLHVVMTLVADYPEAYLPLETYLVITFLCVLTRTSFRLVVVGVVAVLPTIIVSLVAREASAASVVLYAGYTLNFLAAGLGGAYLLERSSRRTFIAEREAAAASARADALLRNVLPDEIADRLVMQAGAIADGVDGVSVVFADVEGFSALAASLPAERVVALLDDLFGRLDDLCDRHGMAKIKTIGDAYMAVAGAPAPDPDHAATAAAFSLDLLTVVDDLSEWPGGLRMRVGIHSGPVVAGVIGRRRLAYDLWGDTVNVASRMESHGEPGAIQVSAETRALLHGRHTFEGPRRIVVKGLGERDVFRLAPDGAP